MGLLCFDLILLLTIVDHAVSQWVINGKVQTFTTATKLSTEFLTFIWSQENQNNWNTKLFYCKNFDLTCDPASNEIGDWYSANITKNTTSYISVFTIKEVNLTLHNTRWLCISVSQSSSTGIADFYLQVYAIAESSSCYGVNLFNDTHIQIQCGTQKSFPESNCHFLVKTNVSSEHYLTGGSVSYQTTQNLSTLYFQTICTYILSAVGLGPGTHMFRVDLYPNITANITKEMKNSSEYTKQITLGYPKAYLGDDCPRHGYIKENNESKCTCYDNSNRFLPTKIVWTSNESNQEWNKTVVFNARRNISFNCTISNGLQLKDTILFQPNISYPPDTLSLNTTQHVFDLCNTKDIFISGSCFYGESNPEPSIDIYINKSLMDITALKQNREYKFNYSISNTGVYDISCFTYSLEYSINVSSVTITIKGPPETPYILQNGHKVTTEPNKPLQIIKGDIIGCEAKGGYPTFKNVSLTCGTEITNATNEDQLNMTIKLLNITDGECECIVWHESKCIQNSSTAVKFKYILSENSKSTGKNFVNIFIAVGVVAGSVLITICFIFMVSQYRLYHLSKISSGTIEMIVRNDDLYFIKQEEKSSFDFSIYPVYTNVVTTMASATEAPKNLK